VGLSASRSASRARAGLLALPVLAAFLLAAIVAAVATGAPSTASAGPGLAEAAPGERIAVPASPVPTRIRLRLPPAPKAGHLWLGRDMLATVRLERRDWRSPAGGFFTPRPDAPLWPSAFVFELPPGGGAVDLVVGSEVPVVLQPRLRGVEESARVRQAVAGLSSALYAVLAVLALVALSLYAAVRDNAYLALLAFSGAGLAYLLAVNGHLYTLPGVRMAAVLGIQGVWALLMLLAAAAVWVARHYAGLRQHAPRLHATGVRVAPVFLALAAVCLLGLHPLLQPMRWITLAGWLAAAAFGLAAAVVAVRERLWYGLPVLAMLVLLVAGGCVREAAKLGFAPDNLWTRFAWQVALAGCSFLLTIGLIARLALVRAERDSERLARDDSERRLQREAARLALVQQLQERLRELPPGDLEWAAFRLLSGRLQDLLRLDAAAMVANGYHGMDLLLSEPVDARAAFADLAERRQSVLRGIARRQVPMQLPLHDSGGGAEGGLHAAVPLPIRAPGWGVLLLRRASGREFTHEELALAADFAVLAMQHAEEAVTAANLRRSAELDALTGTLNRRTIDLWLARSFNEAHRARQSLSVLFIDLDHFKAVNDTHGHACGDACLRHVAQLLRSELEPSDVLGRYGGEEFVLVLPGRDGDAARRLGEKIRDAVERSSLDCSGRTVRLTVSIGVAPRLPEEQAPGPCVERADKALYTAKRGGRNRVCVAPAVFT